jgi:hypothetical protein
LTRAWTSGPYRFEREFTVGLRTVKRIAIPCRANKLKKSECVWVGGGGVGGGIETNFLFASRSKEKMREEEYRADRKGERERKRVSEREMEQHR